MAKAVEFRTYTPQDSRDDLMRRIEQAPREHAEAILMAYDILGNLHQKGLLDIAKGALERGDAVLDHVVTLAASKEAVIAMRTGLMLINVLSGLNADRLHKVIAEPESSPSLLKILRMLLSKETRRVISVGLALLQEFGAALKPRAS
ncbi:DUF1641 domain-containing protein [Terriglobus tenax]|uniref:DUF1641 domain-containing protein n=1 Tax=Terriglobus tenax TaxID=1111115 RepID=UPI0021DF97F5|nr:hypothetical protein [Terriglobus tenax]